jgi:cytochrome oxidase Cu insertion factor (SCO1/SenC/PrrC family)
MIKSMAGTAQPRPLESIVSAFGDFTAAHGFAVNLVAVLALAIIGAGLAVAAVRADARLARAAVIAGAVFCLADWVLIEDLGFFGGLGTDPNSMIPFVLLFTAGYLGLAPAPARSPATAPATVSGATAAAVAGGAPEVLGAPVPDASDAPGDSGETETGEGATAGGEPEEADEGGQAPPEGASGPPVGHPRPARVPVLLRAFAGAPGRVVAGVGALAVILVGAAPMAFASVNRTADPVIAQALAGTNGQPDTPAPGFTLTSQDGRQVSLAGLRGKVVLLTFLDPVCTTDCPLIAQEMRSADAMLGARAGSTELVAVVANPTYTSTTYTRTFTSEEGLGQTPNWLFLTGSLSQLADVWHDYGIEVEDLPAGAMTAHNDLAFVISANGTVRQELSDDPGPGTAATKSSFAGLMADSVLQTMSQS